jgi:hypothetical protein
MSNSHQSISAESWDALRLLAAEDERQSKLHDLLETIREQIRLEIQPENRPDGLFKNIQDAVYAMRGRTRLLDDAAITHALNNAEPLAGLEQRFMQVLDGWEEDGSSPAAVSALQYALGCVRDAMHEVNAIQSRIADGRSDSPSPAIASPVAPSRDEERGRTFTPVQFTDPQTATDTRLILADEYENGLRKMEASGYEEWQKPIQSHKLVIEALRFQARSSVMHDDAQPEQHPAQEALAWWGKWGEQIVQGAVERGNAQYWADNRRQEEAFREWEQSGYEGDCRQCTNGSLTDYITRSVLALGIPSVSRSSAGNEAAIRILSALKACRACRAEQDVEKLKDPVAVHINMLRGGIARPSWAAIKHIYPEHFQLAAEPQGARK